MSRLAVLTAVAIGCCVALSSHARADCISAIGSCFCFSDEVREALEVDILDVDAEGFSTVEVRRRGLDVGPLQPGDTLRMEIADAEVGERWLLYLDAAGNLLRTLRVDGDRIWCLGRRIQISTDTHARLAAAPDCEAEVALEGIREPPCRDTPLSCEQFPMPGPQVWVFWGLGLFSLRRRATLTP